MNSYDEFIFASNQYINKTQSKIDVSNRRMYALQRKSLFYEAKINSCVGGEKKCGLKRQRKLDEGEDIDKKNKIGSG